MSVFDKRCFRCQLPFRIKVGAFYVVIPLEDISRALTMQSSESSIFDNGPLTQPGNERIISFLTIKIVSPLFSK